MQVQFDMRKLRPKIDALLTDYNRANVRYTAAVQHRAKPGLSVTEFATRTLHMENCQKDYNNLAQGVSILIDMGIVKHTDGRAERVK